MEWKSVNDEFPKDEKFYLIGFENSDVIRTSQYWQEDKEWFDSYGNQFHNVTHWMPLPTPPSETETTPAQSGEELSEIERLKALIKKAFKAGDDYGRGEVREYYSDWENEHPSWQDFKTENNL